jgi:hypothetical protein
MNAREIIEAYDRLREDYNLYRSEARACNYEVQGFEHWAGLTNPKAEAQDRLQTVWDRDEWDLY